MTDEDPQQPDRVVGSLPGLQPGLQGAEASALQIRINNSICKSVQLKVENILQDIEKFSDVEKLYLYLKLPSGPSSISSSNDKSDQNVGSSSRTQQMHAFNWICDHLEEYPETSLPKQEVHDEYKSFCDNLNYHPLSAADFGKMMKNVFPNMKARRLGMRGKSKYCYSGLRKRPHVQMPSLPNLDLQKTTDGHHGDILESPVQINNIKEEVRFASCDLVCEWAQKVLKRQFDAVEDLARFLIDSHNISNKSLAALTVMTGTATEAKPSQTISAFTSSADTHPFQSHVKTLSSPSVDAKQQLQRKIQRKQQEQKLHSPSPVDGQSKRPDESVPYNSPASASPQPAIGIMVTTVPSPITVHRSRQLMSPSPVAMIESKVLPINFQMVTQPVQTVRQSPKPAQNLLTSPGAERTGRQRYAQILPKPSATTAITMRSPSTMIIANNPIKTVMSTCHVSPVSLVKMTTLSLAPHSSETTTSFTNRPASASLGLTTATDIDSNQNMRSVSAAPILTSMAGQSLTSNTQNMEIEMEVEAIHNSQMQNHTNPNLTPQAMLNGAGGALERAASVPIPQTKGFMHLEETKNSAKSSANMTGTQNSNNSTKNTNTLPINASTHNNSNVSSLNTSKLPLFGESCQTKEGFLSTKSFRKRSGLSPDLSPIKRVFVPRQPAEGDAGLQYNVKNTAGNFSRLRPESAPATREVDKKLNSISSTQGHTQSTSSCTTSGFNSVAKIHSSMQRKTTSTVMETGTSISQEQQGHCPHTVASKLGFQKQTGVNTNQATNSLEGTQQQMYVQPNPATDTLPFFYDISSNELPAQEHVNYFPFDDDVTQDSIVEELVQMEEQMKLKHLQELDKCGTLQHSVYQGDAASTNQDMTAFYHTINNSIQTPTPTSEMMGGVQSLIGESPCSHIASTTPVDSALGSSRHTPVGTPHSNCSSTVPPSPVECRNPFAFTPINSSIPGFHDSSPISSSPVKPMQRPMATHPDKARLEWMNNSYNSSAGSANKSNNGMGILPGYQGLIDNHFQKPHAFAIPHARHHDGHFGRLTPISPVQQQVASMANMSKQEGFAVPAPLDNKISNSSNAAFRCRSVSPAVHQRNVSGSMGNAALPNVPRSVVSPFNSPVTPEMLSIFTKSKSNVGASSMAQRSRSVPLNIMMQTEVLPTTGQLCTSKNLSNVVLSKLEGDHNDTMRGMGINNLPSAYTARMNLTQILENNPNLSCTDNHLSLISSNSTSTCNSERANYLINDAVNEEMIFSLGNSQAHSVFGEHHQDQSAMLSLNLQQQHELEQQQLPFSTQHLLSDAGLTASNQLMEQMPEITPHEENFPCEIRMNSEFSSGMNDLNGLDTNLLFDPNQQQCQYQNAVSQELVNDPLFQQIPSETSHSGGLDWLESKDHPTVGLMG